MPARSASGARQILREKEIDCRFYISRCVLVALEVGRSLEQQPAKDRTHQQAEKLLDSKARIRNRHSFESYLFIEKPAQVRSETSRPFHPGLRSKIRERPRFGRKDHEETL
jgi:hypothetical protein